VKAGAFDYLTKPFDNDELLIAIARAAEHLKLQTEVIALRAELKTRQEFSGIVATSALMRDVLRQMSRIAGDDGPVLILGESGTGKELVARGIHQQSSRNRGPFVAVNCSAIPAALVEAEFFGYERGAFTDAKETRPGKFEQADGGTLFLDEVGDLHIDAQAKLLRVLQEHVITRLGGRGTIAVNVRVVAATNHDLERAVKVGGFREDLFYRLNVLSLRLPPLRERGEDLSFLIEHFLGRLCAKTGASVSGISPEAMRLLLAHEWRGNVRELENVLHRAVVLAEGPLLRAADLPASVGGGQAAAADGASAYPLTLAASVERTVERVERALIQAALMETGGNQTAAADSLGINRKTLFNKLRLYGLAPVVESDES
jgi:DNA-binding NtrC family response regulator